MSINESSGTWRRSNLTNEQRAQQERALYGDPMQTTDISPADYERMRALLHNHDLKSNAQQVVIDLNHPPQEPYVYRPFPKAIYNHADGTAATVQDQEQLTAHLDAGWQLEPWPGYPEAPEAAAPKEIEDSEPETDDPVAAPRRARKR